ncbi:MAG TPA: hypothetical protein VGR55_00535 [Candidatus Acidoferrum sp.]|nr:hypothetical protein [Candidatus Acidoferrum sp.]
MTQKKEQPEQQQKKIVQPPTREFHLDDGQYIESEADRGLLQSECEAARWYE